jgi:hypothetical protein
MEAIESQMGSIAPRYWTIEISRQPAQSSRHAHPPPLIRNLLNAHRIAHER